MNNIITSLDALRDIISYSDVDLYYKRNGTEFRITKVEICRTSFLELICLINDKNLYMKD